MMLEPNKHVLEAKTVINRNVVRLECSGEQDGSRGFVRDFVAYDLRTQ